MFTIYVGWRIEIHSFLIRLAFPVVNPQISKKKDENFQGTLAFLNLESEIQDLKNWLNDPEVALAKIRYGKLDTSESKDFQR